MLQYDISKTHVEYQVTGVHEILEEVQMKKFLSTRLGPSRAFGNSIWFGPWKIVNWNGNGSWGREGAYLQRNNLELCEMFDR